MATKAVLGVFLGLGLAACQITPQQQPLPTAVGPTTGGSAGGAQGATQQEGTAPSNTVTVSQDQSASVPITLSEKSFTNYGFDPSQLSYHFHYLTVDLSQPIVFGTTGTATILVPHLPSNQTGDLTFEVLSTGTVVMRAVDQNVRLAPGAAQLQLTLQPVNGATGDLTINTSVQPGGTPGTIVNNPPVGGQPVQSLPPVVSNPPINPPVVNNPPVINQPVNNPPVVSNPVNNPPFTGGSQQPSNPNAPSFVRDVAPILNLHCTECHHAGGQQPDLTQAPQSATVDRIVQIAGQGGQMPPAPRDHLSQSELATISNWRNGGMNP